MSPADEQELGRLSALLESIDGTLPGGSPLREALVKAGIALGIAYIDGRRGRVEEIEVARQVVVVVMRCFY
jgi:hypothetical protein